MDHSFSNRLLIVPLFQGFSRLDFLDIVEKIPLGFKTYKPGSTIVAQEEESHSLCILLSGEAEAEVVSPQGIYRFTEKIKAPYTIQIENLFGLHNRYARTFKASTDVQTVTISKQNVRQMLINYPAFQINFYNALSTCAQQSTAMLWLQRSNKLEHRFYNFLKRRSLRPIGEKKLHIRMEDLALELGTTRLRISQALSNMAEKNILSYSRGIIIIPQIEKLLQA